MMVGMVPLIPGVAEIAQSPIASRSLHAHALLLLGAVELVGGFGILEFPFRRHDELANAVRGCFFLVPVVRAADALPLRFVLVLFHVEDGVDEVSVGGFGLVPALQAQVALLQPFDVHLDSLRIHYIDSPIVTVVAFDNESQDILVHAHRFAVVAHARVQLRQKLGHLKCLGIEGSPYTTKIVADVFAESDGV